MEGKIIKTEDGWVIEYGVDNTLPLYPFDVEQIKELSNVFDNIDARIAADPLVEFNIIEVCMNYNGSHIGKDCSCKMGFKDYAKLKKI